MDRRTFFTAAASLVGAAAIPNLGKASECPHPFPDGADGVMVFNIYVGQLPPYKAEAFVARLKDQFSKGAKKHKLTSWVTYWLPQRNFATDVEIYVRDEGRIKQLEPFYLDFFADNAPERSELVEKTKNYVLLMLGAPVVSIELDQSQLDLCVHQALDMVQGHVPNAVMPHACYKNLVNKGALALAKTMLGRIRSKFWTKEVLLDAAPDAIDGQTLLAEGKEEYQEFLDLVVPSRFTTG